MRFKHVKEILEIWKYQHSSGFALSINPSYVSF